MSRFLQKYECHFCKKEVLREPSQVYGRVFCGRLCLNKWQIENSQLFGSNHNKEWFDIRAKKIEEVGHRCELCGKDIKKLDIHHKDLSGFSFGQGSNNSPDNLSVLCASCHSHVHQILIKFFDKKIVKAEFVN